MGAEDAEMMRGGIGTEYHTPACSAPLRLCGRDSANVRRFYRQNQNRAATHSVTFSGRAALSRDNLDAQLRKHRHDCHNSPEFDYRLRICISTDQRESLPWLRAVRNHYPPSHAPRYAPMIIPTRNRSQPSEAMRLHITVKSEISASILS